MYLTVKEVAKVCMVKKDTVLDWIKKNKIDAIKLPSNQYRIEDLDIPTYKRNNYLLTKLKEEIENEI